MREILSAGGSSHATHPRYKPAVRSAHRLPDPPARRTGAGPPASYGLSDIEYWSAGADNIDAAQIATADAGLILAFRGTFPIDGPDTLQAILDWLNDADALLVREPGLPGLVHQGFRNSLDNLFPLFKARLLARVAAAGPATPLFITGHSKGGAIAFLSALLCRAALRQAGLPNPVRVHTFAAARPGDQTFADGFNTAFPGTPRTEYAEDIVPHVPPSMTFVRSLRAIPQFSHITIPDAGFVSAGALQYFPDGSTDTTNPTPDSAFLEIKRLLAIGELLLALKFTTIVNDHSIAPASGYANAVTGGS